MLSKHKDETDYSLYLSTFPQVKPDLLSRVSSFCIDLSCYSLFAPQFFVLPIPILYIQCLIVRMQSEKSDEYLDEFRILRHLGSGYQAEVKLAEDLQGNQVAIKKYKRQTSTLSTLQEELQVMQQLHHENLVRLISVRQNAIYRCQQVQNVCFAIVLEYAGGGELFDYVAETGRFSEKVTRTYFHQMMNGLHYMHERGYAHRDIKPENLLLSDKFVLKIADFGFSCLLRGRDGSGMLRTRLGTEGYMAPEIGTKEYDGRMVDVFAAGVILFIIFAGSPPFEKATPNDPYYKLIKQKRYDLFWQAHARRRPVGFFPTSFRDLFQRMTAFNPISRPSIRDIATHPWVTSSICTHAEIIEEFTERKVRLQQIIVDRQREQERERAAHMEAIRNQDFSCRGSQDHQLNHFAQIYINQKLKPRKIETNKQQQGIIVQSELQYLVSRLKVFLTNHKLKLHEENAQEDDEIVEENEEEGELQMEELQDHGNYIRVTYLTRYSLEENTHHERVVLDIQLSRLNSKQIALKFVPVSGQKWYFRKIVADLRTKCL